MFRWVAEIRRTLTFRVFDDPSRSNSPVSITRNSFCCWVIGTFAIDGVFLVSDAATGFEMGRAHAQAQAWWSGLAFTFWGAELVLSIVGGRPEDIALSAGQTALAVLLGTLAVRALVRGRARAPIDIGVSPTGATVSISGTF